MCLHILQPVPFLFPYPSADGELFIPKFSHPFTSSLNLTRPPSHLSPRVSTTSTLDTCAVLADHSRQRTPSNSHSQTGPPYVSAEAFNGFSSPPPLAYEDLVGGKLMVYPTPPPPCVSRLRCSDSSARAAPDGSDSELSLYSHLAAIRLTQWWKVGPIHHVMVPSVGLEWGRS